MKFWLTCFVLLFAGAELFQWLVNLGGEGLSGAGLVLGGMGLAAASNAKHLPRLASTPTLKENALSEKTGSEKTGSEKTGSEQSATASRQPTEQQTRPAIAQKDTAATVPSATAPRSSVAASNEDSISFKVRLPWR